MIHNVRVKENTVINVILDIHDIMAFEIQNHSARISFNTFLGGGVSKLKLYSVSHFKLKAEA